MASTLLQRLTRSSSSSSFRPAVFASRLLSIHGRPLEQTNPFNQQCYTTTTTTVPPFDKAWLKSRVSHHPALFTRVEGKHFIMQVPGFNKTLTHQGLSLTLHMPGVLDVDATIDGKHLLIQGKINGKTIHLAGMELPPNFDKGRDFLAAMTDDGMLKLTLPVSVENPQELLSMTDFTKNRGFLAYKKDGKLKVFLPFVEIQELSMLHYHMAWRNEFAALVYDTEYFNNARKVLSKDTCKPFTLHKKLTAESLWIESNFEQVKAESTSEGMCVSLNMPGFSMEDVKTYFEDDAFFIEGKHRMELYIGGVRVPEGYEKNNEMIKTEMHQGMFKATLPYMIYADRFFITY